MNINELWIREDWEAVQAAQAGFEKLVRDRDALLAACNATCDALCDHGRWLSDSHQEAYLAGVAAIALAKGAA